ncbi:MAG: DUF1566 domain-containing protein [Saprospiraceae bacterium]|nr:DUF1566 domain-containing protein [Saprospiraceae bacterium]
MRNQMTLPVLLLPLLIGAQNLEVQGKAKISEMDKINTADSVVVHLPDGTLGVRDVSTLTQFQILSISNDTIYLANGGFVKLPSGFNGQYSSLSGAPTNVSQFTNDIGYLTSEMDGSTSNEIQTISRTGLTVNLSDGGGSFQDSVNVYTAGAGIAIANKTISATNSTSPWFIGKDTLGGIVYYIFKGSDGLEHGLIVSKTESALEWQSLSSLVTGNSSWDGANNTGLMINSPAKTFVQSLGGGWYLPSIDELSLLWHNRFHINKTLSIGGFTLLAQNTFYWSSTEINLTVASGFEFGYGNMNYTSKTNAYSVRGIRTF